MIDKNAVYKVEKYLREKGVLDDSFGGLKMQLRKEGKRFSFEEHLQGLIYSQMSAQAVWANIERHFKQIDELFFHYNIHEINGRDGSYFSKGIISIGCGSRLTNKQMVVLHKNIEIMLSIVADYGSMDDFVTSAPAQQIVRKLSDSQSKYKLHQVGPALAWEYIRNVGIDGAKPDLHMKRIFGSSRLGCSKHESASDEEIFTTVKRLSEETGYFMAQIDYILWCFCAKGQGEICTAEPHCGQCPIRDCCSKMVNLSGVKDADFRNETEKSSSSGKSVRDSERKVEKENHYLKKKGYGGLFRDQYFDEYLDFLRNYSDKKRISEGKNILSDATIKTSATDTFFLEKHEDKNFGYWFQNDQTMKEAENCLSKHLAGRKKPQNDLKYYLEDMIAFREFLKDRDK